MSVPPNTNSVAKDPYKSELGFTLTDNNKDGSYDMMDVDSDGKVDYYIGGGMVPVDQAALDLLNKDAELKKNKENGNNTPPKPEDKFEKPQIPNQMPTPPPLPDDTSVLGDTKLPVYEAGKEGETQVNTEALQQFSKTLDHLGEPLKNLQLDVSKISVKAGAFYQAFHLENALHDDTGLQPNTRTVITGALDAFAHIKKGINELVKEYDTVEELNEMGVEDLKTTLNTAQTLINKLSS